MICYRLAKYPKRSGSYVALTVTVIQMKANSNIVTEGHRDGRWRVLCDTRWCSIAPQVSLAAQATLHDPFGSVYGFLTCISFSHDQVGHC